jgi:hypothetical protein
MPLASPHSDWQSLLSLTKLAMVALAMQVSMSYAAERPNAPQSRLNEALNVFAYLDTLLGENQRHAYRDKGMRMRQSLLAAVVAPLTAFCLSIGLVGSPASAMSGTEVLKKMNHDQDQTLEIPEVITAATATFNKINPDHDMTLEAAETKHILTAEEWKQFNVDGDSTLELDEWLAIARARFKAADTASTGKLTAAELDTPAGQSLIQMFVQ